jgi:Flp pilus assembly pilin Flp
MKKTVKQFKNTRLHKNEEGATAIEFAIIAPLLFMLMFGMIQFGVIMFMKSVLDNAMNTASRLGITGSNYAGTSYADNPAIQEALGDDNNGGQGITREFIIRETAQRLSGGIITGQDLEIGCTNLGQTNVFSATEAVYEGECNFGSAGDVIIYNARYNWDLFIPLTDYFLPGVVLNGKFPITSSIAVKNEQSLL